MTWLPTDRLLVAALVATPPTRLTGLPKFVPSITNCTVPDSVPLPAAAATVAVKVTPWPDRDGLTDELTTVLVVAGATVCVSAAAVLLEKLVSPL
jgi:hypothetical protein